ncbi:dienelactone hydrolase family protein [Maritimibacter sp. DP1N21-5]|uniref:dienelactone hydrolase family protein n=1 Tax=Maritimibacter sp. DP1N21-5 TaxID=2836867 RepID=UPI001C47521E|nr:dienelactone hydrolase family protein [Maritimibacter sp. DP1N21-5]MBV7408571.1 dienelactone hydrolase family protein [Maritimibacter sp. DP1N21-5]
MIRTEKLTYEVEGAGFVCELFWDDALSGARPGVIVAPAFWGMSDFERDRAKALVEMGYAALVVDYYGAGRHSTDPAEARRWKDEVEADRTQLRDRMRAALALFKARDEVEAKKVVAMGYCFGGKAVLDLARSGADLAGVVPIHGIFDRPNFDTEPMKASVLALHGWADALARPEAVVALGEELDAHCADWQLLALGHTGHGFTNPASDNYTDAADRRSWRALIGFLEDTFG